MANEIGKVAVRVYPDTTGFAQETKRKLERLKDQKYPVKVEVDENKLNRQIDLMVAKINASLAKDKNHIKFRAKLDLTNAEARSQVSDVRKKYQAMADTAREVNFSSKLKEQAEDAVIKVTPEIDQEQFTRDLNRAVKQATRNNEGVSIWGSEDQVRSQSQRAVDIFRERLVEANRDIPMFGDQANLDEKARNASLTIRDRFRETLKDLNPFGETRHIEDDAVTAIDIFKRKWKAAQGQLNIRADLEYDKAEFDQILEDHDALQRSYDQSADHLAAQTREYQRIVREAAKIRVEMDKMTKAAAKIDKLKPGGLKQWQDITKELEKQGKLHKNMIVWSREFGERNRGLVQKLSIDSGSLVDSEARVEQWRRHLEISDITLNVDIKTAAAEAWMQFITRPRVVEIRTKIDGRARAAMSQLDSIGKARWGQIGKVLGGFGARSSGIRLLWQTTKDMLDIVPRLDMAIPKLAQTSALAATTIAGAGALLGSAVSVVADMMKAAQVALIAPAGLAGLAVVGLVLYSAFRDLKNVLPEVGQRLSEIRDVASDSFWSTAKPQIASFFDVLLTSLEKWTPAVSKQVGRATGALADGLREGLATHADRFFDNLNKGLKAAEGGFKSLGSALMGLIGAGSDSFESLGTWFTGVMGDFDDWVKKNDANGNITKWIDEGAQAIRDIGSLIMSTGSIFQTFGDLVKEAGGPSLSDFARGMRELRDAVKGDWFRTISLGPLTAMFDFIDEFDRIKPDAMKAIATASGLLVYSLNGLKGPTVDAFGAIFRGFSSPTFINGWTQFIDGIGNFLTDINPGLERFVSELGGLMGIVGVGADSFGEAFNELLILVSNIGANIHPGLEDFLKFIGPELEELIKAVGPGLEDMATGISDILSNRGFQRFLSDVADKFKIIVPFLTDVVNGILDLVEALFNGYDKAPAWLQDTTSWIVALGGAALIALPLIKPLLWPLTALLGLFKTPIKNLAKNSILAALDGLSKIKFKMPNFAKLLPAGGLARLVGPALARFVGVLSGPVGWALLVASLIRPIDFATFADWIVDGLGLEDTWLGRLTESLKTSIDEFFGDDSLLDLFLRPFKDAWDSFAEGDWKSGIARIVLLNTPEIGLTVAEAIASALNWEQGVTEAEAAKQILKEGGLAGLLDAYKNGIVSAFDQAWAGFNTWADSARPDWWNTDIREWLMEGWGEPLRFTTYDGYTISADMKLVPLWNEVIRPSLEESWSDFKVAMERDRPSWWNTDIRDWLWNGWGEPFTWTTPRGYEIRADMSFGELWSDVIWPGLQDAWSDFNGWANSTRPTWWDIDLREWLWNGWGEPFTWTTPRGYKVRADMSFGELWGDVIWPGLQDAWADLNGWMDSARPDWWNIDLADWLWNGWGEPFTWTTPRGYEIRFDMTFGELWNDVILPGLQDAWDEFNDWLDSWRPDWWNFDLGGWLWGKIKEFLGVGESSGYNGGGSSTSSSLIAAANADGGLGGDWGEDLYTMVFLQWLTKGWSTLIAKIMAWVPGTIFSIFTWLGSKLGDWLAGGATGLAGGLVNGVGGVLDWGAKKWTDGVKPWLDKGWETLKGGIANWNPAGGSGVGSAIDRALGTDEGSAARTNEKLIALGGQIGTLAGTAVGKFAEMGTGGRREIKGLADDTDAEFGRMNQSGSSNTTAMSGSVVGNMLGMNLGGVAQALTLQTGTTGQFESMKAQATAKAEVMKAGVVAKMTAMSVGAAAKAESMKAAVTAKAEAMRASATAKAGAMQTSVTAKMAAMSTAASARAAAMQTSVISKMSAMQASATAKAAAMSSSVISRMSSMSARAGAQAAAMSAKVISRMSSMQSKASASAASMSAKVISRMSAMASRAGAQASAMGAKVVAQMSSMSSRAVAQMVRFQSSAVRAISSASRAVVSQGRAMASGFASAMSSMASRAMSIVGSLRGRLSAGLRINAGGAGRFTGGTFVSGLAGGLSRAVGVAYSMAGRIRGALSFSAFGSGSAVGGSFASGIRSRIGAVAAAASRLAAAARRRMPNSPAKEGPFSGSGWGGWGESIGDELARGLKKAAPTVAKEADALMGGVTDALDSRAEIGVGASRNAAKAATAARIATAQAQGEESEGNTTAADLRDAVSKGLSDMLAPANDRDLVAIVRRANRNGDR